MSLSGVRPACSLVFGCSERRPPTSMRSCCVSRREQEALEQTRRVRMRRFRHHCARRGDERRSLRGIDDLHRLSRLLQREEIVFVAVGHDRALADGEFLRRLGRGLHLHDLLLAKLLQIVPTEITRNLERRGKNRAAVTGMSLDDHALPFRVEQVGEALRRIGRLHIFRVVADRAQSRAPRGVKPVRVGTHPCSKRRHPREHRTRAGPRASRGCNAPRQKN